MAVSVGELRLSKPKGATTGVLNTGTVNDGTVNTGPHDEVKKSIVTWADVVKRTAGRKAQLERSVNDKVVLQRSFSENNSLNRKV